jgi:hypothetical protein
LTVSASPFALVAFADLQHEFAVGRELQVSVIGDRFEPGEARGRTIVSAQPHKALVVDMDAVLALGRFGAVHRSKSGHPCLVWGPDSVIPRCRPDVRFA